MGIKILKRSDVKIHLLLCLLWRLSVVIDARQSRNRTEVSGCEVGGGAFWVVKVRYIRAG